MFELEAHLQTQQKLQAISEGLTALLAAQRTIISTLEDIKLSVTKAERSQGEGKRRAKTRRVAS